MGVRQRWWVGTVCKSVAFRFRGFESLHSHIIKIKDSGFNWEESAGTEDSRQNAVELAKGILNTQTKSNRVKVFISHNVTWMVANILDLK